MLLLCVQAPNTISLYKKNTKKKKQNKNSQFDQQRTNREAFFEKLYSRGVNDTRDSAVANDACEPAIVGWIVSRAVVVVGAVVVVVVVGGVVVVGSEHWSGNGLGFETLFEGNVNKK